MFFSFLCRFKVDEKIDFLIRLLQLPNVTRFIKNLSGGQQRRMSLAAALLHGSYLKCVHFLNGMDCNQSATILLNNSTHLLSMQTLNF